MKWVTSNSISKTHLLQIMTKRGKMIFNNEELSEDRCFECKDGGEITIYNYRQVVLLKNNFIFGIIDEIY